MDTYDFDMDAWDNMIVSLPVLEQLLEDCNEKLLEGAFLWDHTPEGEEYWYNQYWGHAPLDLDRLLMIYEVMAGEPFESLGDTPDKVNSPPHYGQGNIECIEYIEDFLTQEEYIGYLRGNIAKYLHRWRYKNGLEDLNKSQWYLNELIRVVKE